MLQPAGPHLITDAFTGPILADIVTASKETRLQRHLSFLHNTLAFLPPPPPTRVVPLSSLFARRPQSPFHIELFRGETDCTV